MTLTEFLLARIAEDEAVARDAAEVPPLHSNRWQLSTVKVETLDGVTHTRPRGTVEAAPRRVLAECEAKRRIVEDYLTLDVDYRVTHAAETGARRFQALVSVAQLATAYSDHPEYDKGWRP